MKGKFSRRVAIIGVGMSGLGFVTETPSIKNMTGRELWTWACAEAMKDAGISPCDIDALVVGNMVGEITENQYHMANVLARWTGLKVGDEVWKPAVRVEGACASSSHAIRQAAFAIASGVYDVVITGGVELNNAITNWKTPGQPRRMSNEDRIQTIYRHYDQAWELPQMSLQDQTLNQWLLAYSRRYGLSIDKLLDVLDARITSNYSNGSSNNRAYQHLSLEEQAIQKGFSSVHDFLRSPENNPVATWPSRLWDGPRRCDGAAAVIMCAADLVKETPCRPIYYLGTGNAGSNMLSELMYTHPFIVEAGREAFSMAGVIPSDIGLAEVYDFAPAEYLIPLEDLGYFKPGEAAQALLEARTTLKGDHPVNPSGGTMAGLVVGAVGSIMIYHMVQQLRGEAGQNQVRIPTKIGLVYDCGAARDAVVHILGR